MTEMDSVCDLFLDFSRSDYRSERTQVYEIPAENVRRLYQLLIDTHYRHKKVQEDPLGRRVDYIPLEASFAQAPEWEPAIDAGITQWIRNTNIGDRRKVIAIFNDMLYCAPTSTKGDSNDDPSN
jgi:hypothetical protein